MDSFVDQLDDVLSCSAVQAASNIVVVGDFNAKHAAWYSRQGTDLQGDALKSVTDSHDLHQTVSAPTYNISSDNPALLDLCFTNRPASVLSTITIPGVADHLAVITRLSVKKAAAPKRCISRKFDYHTAS